MKRIFVTGANGFLGKHCLRKLVSKDCLIFACYHDSKPAFLLENIKWLKVDLKNTGALRTALDQVRPTDLLHLAWSSSSGMALNKNDHNNWLEISKKLIKAFYQVGGLRILVAGSCAEYGQVANICIEDQPLHPHTDYGRSKSQLHDWADTYCREKGIDLVWPRIFFTYGPEENQRRLVSSIILSLSRKEAVQTTNGLQIRDYLYVDDVARALTLLLMSTFKGVINISSGQPIRQKMVVEKIRDLMHVGEGIDYGSMPSSATDFKYMVGDNRSLCSLLDWKPAYTLEEGLRATIQSLATEYND